MLVIPAISRNSAPRKRMLGKACFRVSSPSNRTGGPALRDPRVHRRGSYAWYPSEDGSRPRTSRSSFALGMAPAAPIRDALWGYEPAGTGGGRVKRQFRQSLSNLLSLHGLRHVKQRGPSTGERCDNGPSEKVRQSARQNTSRTLLPVRNGRCFQTRSASGAFPVHRVERS